MKLWIASILYFKGDDETCWHRRIHSERIDSDNRALLEWLTERYRELIAPQMISDFGSEFKKQITTLHRAFHTIEQGTNSVETLWKLLKDASECWCFLDFPENYEIHFREVESV